MDTPPSSSVDLLEDWFSTSTRDDLCLNSELTQVRNELWGSVARSEALLTTVSNMARLTTPHIQTLLDQYYDPILSRWKNWPEGDGASMLAFLLEIASHVAMLDGQSNSIFILDAKTFSSKEAGEHLSSEINPFIYAYASETMPKMLYTCGFAAKRVFASRLDLTLFPAVVVAEELAYFVHFDKAGAVSIPPVHMNKEPHRFITLIMGYVKWTMSARDSTISVTPGGIAAVSGPSTKEFEGHLILEKTLHDTGLIKGRCSRVFLTYDIKLPDIALILKDWWRHAEGPDEGNILRQVSGLFGLPQYVHHWTVTSEESQQVTALLGSDLALCPIFSEGDHLSREQRIHSRMLVRTVGNHLLTYRSNPRKVLTAIHDAILGHWGLYTAGYSHNDVSYGNILVLEDPISASYYHNSSQLPVSPLNSQCHGFLNDLDMSRPTNEIQADGRLLESAGGDALGSMQYLGYQKLTPLTHRRSVVKDNLESFFWVLVCTAFWLPDPDPAPESWNESIEHTIKIALFPKQSLPGKSLFGTQKLGLLNWMQDITGYWRFYDSTSELYRDIIERWAKYFVTHDLYSVEEEYSNVLRILRECLDACSV
ncbi:hypothetical protein SISNIDRAFT_111622 [Sistotremastrum niveocremeum HHB9708]|uniref:Fungal-type protein kinase domain-containing protein n=1 Tax=Sistotremastrum niveocremeum HHB9708 TaxID=1314777 RepID=A0A164TI44_9AGAM|nr:hypothetical protein SISNIDRAFT_111622 [Sistotremastrum niveocremeum HHB9708]